jgi:hypothetical protein
MAETNGRDATIRAAFVRLLNAHRDVERAAAARDVLIVGLYAGGMTIPQIMRYLETIIRSIDGAPKDLRGLGASESSIRSACKPQRNQAWSGA